MEIPIYMTTQRTSINHNQSNIFSLVSLHVLQHKKYFKKSMDSFFMQRCYYEHTEVGIYFRTISNLKFKLFKKIFMKLIKISMKNSHCGNFLFY